MIGEMNENVISFLFKANLKVQDEVEIERSQVAARKQMEREQEELKKLSTTRSEGA